MPKSLLSLFAVLSLWTVAAPAQDATPEKAKTDDSQPSEKKATPDAGKEKSDDSKPKKKSADDSEKTKADDSKPADKKPGIARKAPVKPALKTTPTPPASFETPAPKPGFFSRVFGSRPKATPKPAATPAATPAPKVRRRRPIEKRAEPESSSESTTDGTKVDAEKKADGDKKTDEEKKGNDGKKGDEEKKVEAEKKGDEDKKAEGEKKTDEQKKGNDGKNADGEKKAGGVNPAEKKVDAATPVPSKKHGKGKKPEASTPAPVEPAAPVDPETAERSRFEHAKARALEDPQVQELKTKADSAVTDEEGKKALRAYNKALFSKMRKLDGGLKDRIDIMESVILKHLDE